MRVLVTGGAGYIGSHTCVELLSAGHEVIIVDNLCNSKEMVLDRIKKITNKDIRFYKIDITDRDELEKVFISEKIDVVIHFAGLKAVGESVAIPLKYYYNNLTGTLILCELMQKYKVKNLVFSSSATVYGDPISVPISEEFSLSCTNPYGRTKLMIEEILRDLYISDNTWNIAILRYFNPIGAHISGIIGEDPNGIPNNLVPYIAQVAVGKLKVLNVYGNDYDTVDGTGVRDYIHVVDLAKGHLKALDKLVAEHVGVREYNLGTGSGYSVLQVVKAFERACGKEIPYKIVDRRPGDIAACYAKTDRAKNELGWEAEKGLDEMCQDTWRWQSLNPDGYNA
ncbi:UDP-glucose 4-epimerase GalE [Ruminiclostridium herbifermentans]|uniref:UDP-glucose 4-epimerase n=1 Tax=Ruminiclostridium herbifermentans TaxID=2488810 RepID=A0A4U7JJV0_9FIRM|nr:UDP-glucose 4-epimerase GalE [Ruminiclostridium herbifermentans]QNU67570.1 UDP-glucose 4-epimerase GalE [Ruminiclostridium herbifermentans]